MSYKKSQERNFVHMMVLDLQVLFCVKVKSSLVT